MQHVNDDMDELFRRAGEEYPLDTSGADWSKIAKELNIPATEKTAPENSNKKLLWLLLLLPFSFICTQYFSDNSAGDTSSVSKLEKNTANAELQTKKDRASESKKTDSQNLSKGKQTMVVNDANVNFDVVSNTNKNWQEDGLAAKTSKKGADRKSKRFTMVDASFNQSTSRGNIFSEKIPAGEKQRGGIDFALKSYPSFINNPRSADQKNIVEAKPDVEKQQQRRSKKFYIGIMGGVDATSVKFQKVENAGYDAGVLLGFDLNKKWSVETGVFLDKKFYYSKGEYFNTSKIYLPPNSEISMVDGDCSMWEVPLKLLYNFKDKGNHNWFVTAGVSSYFMTKQNYEYDYYYPMTGQNYYAYKSYNNTSNHILSIAQFSGGYIHRLGKLGDLRIEPYIKMPLKGVGVGSLYLKSAGIQVGVTRKMF
ncbi:MAG: outer membrane beta-barrel protein [Flavisolibacter sp.]